MVVMAVATSNDADNNGRVGDGVGGVVVAAKCVIVKCGKCVYVFLN